MSEVQCDVLIIGAGLSGVDAAWHLQHYARETTYVILENRERIGGTWDLFRYPGVRSDSDMLTLGYGFRPWTHPSAIAPGDTIRDYITSTAQEAHIDDHIRFRHRVVRADWSSGTARWTVEAAKRDEEGNETIVHFTARFLFSCAGYYRYDAGYTPDFIGRERFRGTIVHPQQWPADLDYAGKRIVVIGSGATAVTLVPSLAKTAEHVTMLQRSPTYYISRPRRDRFANFLRKVLPLRWAHAISRGLNIFLQRIFYARARSRPERIKRALLRHVSQLLGPGHDIETHFTPKYNPWDQRVCLVPDADLFIAIREGRASVVTDHIETFTEGGIRLQCGVELPADIIVTATGLQLEVLGGIQVTVDDQAVDFGKTFIYRGAMYTGVPNLASVFGYTNASWTLRADLTCEWVCRLLNYMGENNVDIVVPKVLDPDMQPQPLLDFSSGYVTRALAMLPKQGPHFPFRQRQNYYADRKDMRNTPVDDGYLEFSRVRVESLNAASE